MTKLAMKNEALALLTEHKANKKLTVAITELMENYAKTGKLDSVKRPKFITIKGTEYQWCNRHEIYEPLSNFKNDKSPECKLATKYWTYLGTKVKDAQIALEKYIDLEEFDKLKEAKKEIDIAKALRGGRYSFTDNNTQFGSDIEDFFYSPDNHITVEQAEAE